MTTLDLVPGSSAGSPSAAATASYDVCVVGLGYIGLPTAAIVAQRSIRVLGVDVDPRVIDAVSRGTIHIEEPGLAEQVAHAVERKLLSVARAPQPASVFLIAVPTPFKDDYEPDLKYVRSAALSVAPVLKQGDLVVLESTSPVGATEQMCEWLAEARPDLDFPRKGDTGTPDVFVAYCPERVLPGRTCIELVKNDRVIGGITPACAHRAAEFYRRFVEGDCAVTDARTAELCKLSENSFRDVNIAFANELSLVAARFEVDIWSLIRLANRHPRVSILEPGPGVGGHCIAVDPWFIVSGAPEQSRLIRTAREVNDYKPQWVLEKVRHAIAACRATQGDEPVRIAVLGLAFKPDVDDLRESPAVMIADALTREPGCDVLIAEPHIDALPAELQAPNAHLVEVDAALAMADLVVVLVKHRAFHSVDLAALHGKAIVDTKGLWQ
ncbi:UDP-N-acetyl-D-mannosamine dehydrogenase [Paraburkholderia sp. Ac-20336]|uniref:UDP-N-acetyl-D-mannosamine dehydrogenase n=1 Tax=Paraburkholderia sp. Ac-20336 TaxID=2703886 RepID=UPI00197F7142|nr:UDP-N-acetyl-D-mannosamine dehydrogenase [Paraburkholderia sp. Ac-20336]MBN3804516.1 UDP-N-acetyl-D-mannosamine dehydrogenase [Paraburkholderia sp. Ac-20336]